MKRVLNNKSVNLYSKASYFTILPAIIRYNKKLPYGARLLFSDIQLLAKNENGKYCFATNNYFAKLYEVHKNTISAWIRNLKEHNYINIKMIYKIDSKEISERRIFLNHELISPVNDINDTGDDVIHDTPISLNSEDNNTSYEYININNNTDFYLLISEDIKLKSYVLKKYEIDQYSFDHYLKKFIDYTTSSEEKSLLTFSKNSNDLKEWFKNWLNKKVVENIEMDDINWENAVKYYIDSFNRITRRSFKNKTGLKESLKNSKKNGYTFDELELAMKNLYSNDVKRNKYHIESGYMHATPQFLLKENNLDKYLNMHPYKLRDLQNKSGS